MHKSTISAPDQAPEALSIGDRLRMWRRSQALTQLELGNKLDVDVGTLRKYELGVNVPGAQFLVKALALGLNINWVLSGVGAMTRPLGLITLSGEPATQLALLGDALATLRTCDEGKFNLLMRGFTSRVKEATRLAVLEKSELAAQAGISPPTTSAFGDGPDHVFAHGSGEPPSSTVETSEDTAQAFCDEFPDLISTRPAPIR